LTLGTELHCVIDSISGNGKDCISGDGKMLLDRLVRLTARALKLSASSHDRFAASAAYSKLVDDRMGFLAGAYTRPLFSST